jgi:hypothetical protein
VDVYVYLKCAERRAPGIFGEEMCDLLFVPVVGMKDDGDVGPEERRKEGNPSPLRADLAKRPRSMAHVVRRNCPPGRKYKLENFNEEFNRHARC